MKVDEGGMRWTLASDSQVIMYDVSTISCVQQYVHVREQAQGRTRIKYNTEPMIGFRGIQK